MRHQQLIAPCVPQLEWTGALPYAISSPPLHPLETHPYAMMKIKRPTPLRYPRRNTHACREKLREDSIHPLLSNRKAARFANDDDEKGKKTRKIKFARSSNVGRPTPTLE
jgi:hypothetical protein